MSKLKEYLKLFTEKGILCECTADENTEIGYISYNSQDIKENTFFLCKGAHFKEQFLLEKRNGIFEPAWSFEKIATAYEYSSTQSAERAYKKVIRKLKRELAA